MKDVMNRQMAADNIKLGRARRDLKRKEHLVEKEKKYRDIYHLIFLNSKRLSRLNGFPRFCVYVGLLLKAINRDLLLIRPSKLEVIIFG